MGLFSIFLVGSHGAPEFGLETIEWRWHIMP
jgi:hypothetical protein